MSSARCLNWSRPPPGRHPALRKQVSCFESSYSSTDSAPPPTSPPCAGPGATPPPHSVNSARGTQRRTSLPVGGSDDFCQFLVTSAIIHTNRFQNYHTYDQARRGGSASLVRQRLVDVCGGADGHSGAVRRPASASIGRRTTVADSSLLAAPDVAKERAASVGRRGVLCKQISLDQSILVQSSLSLPSPSSKMATVSSGGTMPSNIVTTLVGGDQGEASLVSGDGPASERTSWNGFNRKQQRASVKHDSESGGRKGMKAGKDSRINIKIFLGQTVQQDSSDTGVSDTEGTTSAATMQSGCNQTVSNHDSDTASPHVSTEPPSSTASAGLGVAKAKFTNGTGTNSTSIASSTQSGTNSSCGSANGTTSSNGSNNNGNSSNGSNAGRNSSLAQRRAQFQANRQNSEAHDRRHPPLVRALSAPIRPADPDTSKFLQSKKKPRRKRVLKEKDEYNICEEDEFSDEADSKMAPGNAGVPSFGAANTAGKQIPTVLPMRSRSVLGGACDIETLVSLLSSGGSDSEKEQDSTQTCPATVGSQSPTGITGNGGGIPASAAFRQQFSSVHLSKGRAPMLKKTGKSVSFQESDLKPAVATAGLNRDYRKPSFQPTVANRIRRTQQLVSTLNAFQLKDKEKGNERDSSEEKNDRPTKLNIKDTTSTAETPALSASTGKAESNKSTPGASGGIASTTSNGDLQTPKEQECYRLFLKMSKKGLAVSYDTILRGMLTPTELRVLQKKKSRQRQNTDVTMEQDPSSENGALECDAMAFEELHLKELHFHRNSQTKDEERQLQLQDAPSPIHCDGKESGTDDENTSSKP